MQFFQQQRRAKENTFQLVVLFILAVAILSALVGIFVHFALGAQTTIQLYSVPMTRPVPTWHDSVFWTATLLTATTIMLVSFFKVLTTTSGEGVARSLGGREVIAVTAKPQEKQLLNVVEEMAIASGLPIPRVFILSHDSGINAFAAGLTKATAVIAVTQGALNLLNRDELQAVIGHEMSHILNEDMALNVRIGGILAGLVFISKIGDLLTTRNSRADRGNTGTANIIGLGLWVIGGLGAVFARVIQSIISQQREYLADAAAVQFTRNPEALAQALAKIQFNAGSWIASPNKHDFAHLFFAEPVELPWFMFNVGSHPTIRDRIQRLDPRFDAADFITQWMKANPLRSAAEETHRPAADTGTIRTVAQVAAALAGAPSPQVRTAHAIVSGVGKPSLANLCRAQQVLNDLPEATVEASHDPIRARAVLIGIILSEEPEAIVQEVLQIVAKQSTSAQHDMEQTMQLLRGQTSRRWSLLQITISTLKQIPRDDLVSLRRSVQQIANRDGNRAPFEWAIELIIDLDLIEPARPTAGVLAQSAHLEGVHQSALQLIVWWLLQMQKLPPEQLSKNYFLLLEKIGLVGRTPSSLPPMQYEQFKLSIQTLAGLNLMRRQKVVEILWSTINVDGERTEHEIELVRMLCHGLKTPVPMFQ